MKIGRHRLQPRAFIILALLILILGGWLYDKQTQGGAARQTTTAVPEGGKTRYEKSACYTFTGSGTSNEGTGPLQKESPGSNGTGRAASENELSEHGNNEKVEEARSLPVSISRGSSWGRTGLSGSLFDTVGIEFKVTAYTAGYESTGKCPGDKGYGITYSGKKVRENHTIAADLTILPLGTKVLIEGLDAVFTVEDKGSAVKGKHIDLYMPDLKEAQGWGVQYRRIIVLVMGGT